MTKLIDVDERARQTYRYVRIVVLLPAAWLIASIVMVFIVRREVLDSISDYYGGPLRDVFVGGLMACGICMIAYKGQSKLEDYALNFAGFNAFFVALVPNSFPEALAQAPTEVPADDPLAVTRDQLEQNLQIAVGLFLLVAAVFIALDVVLMWTKFKRNEQSKPANAAIYLSAGAEVVLLGFIFVMVFGFDRDWIYTVVHFVSAALLVVNLSLAAASNAFGKLHLGDEVPSTVEAPAKPRYFKTITYLMWAGIVIGGIAIAVQVPYAVIVTELWEILLFMFFWVRATRSEWRRQPAAVPAARGAS